MAPIVNKAVVGKFKLKSRSKFISAQYGGVGTAVRKDGFAAYTDLDYRSLSPSFVDPASQRIATQSTIDGTFGAATLKEIFDEAQSAALDILDDAEAAAVAAEASAAAAATAAASINSFFSVLSLAEQADVISGTNSIDLTAKINALLIDTDINRPGTVVDLSALHGNDVIMTGAGWFANMTTAKLTLITGKVTIRKNFNNGGIRRPSYLRWEWRGTEIKQLVGTPLLAIPNGNDSEHAMITTTYTEGTASGSFSSDYVTAASVAGVQVGARIAINGTSVENSLFAPLAGNITNSATSFSLSGDVSHTVNGFSVYMQIDNEVIYCDISKLGVVTVLARGALGTTAASHTISTPAYWMAAHVATVTSIDSNTNRIYLDKPLVSTFTNATFRAGTVDTYITGSGLVDGGYDRDDVALDTAFYQLFGSVLGANDVIDSSIRMRAAPFAGIFLYAADRPSYRFKEQSYCARPSVGLGGGTWMFGAGQKGNVTIDNVDDTYVGIIIDNKSEQLDSWGLTRPWDGPKYAASTVTTVHSGFDITGCNDSNVDIGYLDADTYCGGIFNSSTQNTTSVTALRNTAIVRAEASNKPMAGDALVGNNVIRFSRTITNKASITLSSVSVTAGATASQDFTVAGAEVGGAVAFTPDADLAAGLVPGAHRVTASNTVRLIFLNGSSTSKTLSGTGTITVTKP